MAPPPPPVAKKRRVKKRLVKKKKGAATAPQVIQAPPKPVEPMSFTDKDPWGYRFLQTMWRYEPGINDGMRKDPNDNERTRVLRVLQEVYGISAEARLDHGFDNNCLPWGAMHHDRQTPRKKLAERIRTLCLKSPGGKLGIAQLRYLLAEAELCTTLIVTGKSKSFPLDLDISDPVLKKSWKATYTRHLDRIFYLVQPTTPPPGRFDPPLLVVDPMRFDTESGYALARNVKKQALVSIDTKSIDGGIFKLEVATSEPLHFREDKQRDPAGELRRDDQVIGRIVSLSKMGEEGLRFRMNIDHAGSRLPWMALGIVLADLFVQRSTGAMLRAVAIEREKVEKEKAEAEDLLLQGLPAAFRHRVKPFPPKKPGH